MLALKEMQVSEKQDKSKINMRAGENTPAFFKH